MSGCALPEGEKPPDTFFNSETFMHLLGLVKSVDHVCCRYRLAAFGPFLADQGHHLQLRPWPASWLSGLWFHRQLRHADVVIIQRRLVPAWELALIRRWARRLVFDLDDAIFLRDSYAKRGPTCPWRQAGFARMVAVADAVVAGNAFLADHAAMATAAHKVHVVPTCIDLERYTLARHERGGDAVQMAWIGSSSTLRGLEQTRPLWEHIGWRLPGVTLKLICDRPLSLRFLPVHFRPWSESTEAAELASADIGVSWLPDDAWSRGKCGLKVLQYMAAGLPVVANAVGVQAQMVRHGETGMLVETADEWCRAVQRLAASPGLRRRMGLAGRRVVEHEFSVAAGAAAWRPVLDQLAGRTAAVGAAV
jgi:glycosyltransferase involved in cell wall biosynthesis